jgi:hypothetical protein
MRYHPMRMSLCRSGCGPAVHDEVVATDKEAATKRAAEEATTKKAAEERTVEEAAAKAVAAEAAGADGASPTPG